jgi:ParB/RepB/Spo0J family partition protein
MKQEFSTTDAASISNDLVWSLHQDLPPEPGEGLVQSIRHFGLLRPIITRRLGEHLELICGARRLHALRQVGQCSDIPCFIIDQNLETGALLQLVGEDQRQTAPLSPIEAGRLIALFENVEGKVDNSELEKATGISSSRERQRLTALLRLEEPIRQAVHSGAIPVKNGLLLAGLTGFERTFMAELFARLSLNGNKQRRLLELAMIISVSEQCSLTEVFSLYYPAVCSDPIDNVPQVSAQLMKGLYERSHPFLAATHRQFNKKRDGLNLPDNCSLSPYPDFERDTVTLEVEFKDFDSFERAWSIIRQSV